MHEALAVSETTGLDGRSGRGGGVLVGARDVSPVGVDRQADAVAAAQSFNNFEADGGGASVGAHQFAVFGVVGVVGGDVATVKVTVDGDLGKSRGGSQGSQCKTNSILLQSGKGNPQGSRIVADIDLLKVTHQAVYNSCLLFQQRSVFFPRWQKWARAATVWQTCSIRNKSFRLACLVYNTTL